MTTLVTGGTGFIGAHLVRALLARGESVRCLARRGSRRDNLDGLDVEIATGDLCDAATLRPAVAGCDAVYHCAADYRLYARDPQEIYSVNVEGTRCILRAAAEAGASKIVYTSSVGALGLGPKGTPATETTPVSLERMIGHYKRSKFMGERVAEEIAREGAPVVIVNPSTPVGELDIKPTPTGKMIVDFLNRRMPAYVDTGLNLIDVRDVAEGHLLAAERGKPGERYILGHQNLSLREIFSVLSRLTGLPAPRFRVPHFVPEIYATISTTWAEARGLEPRVSIESVRMSRYRMYFDAAKAVRELGLRQTPVENALDRAVAWFRAKGYAPAR